MKVLVNCFSIPPANKGGAGAAKYLQALLPELAKLCDLSVFVSPLNKSDYDFKDITLIETNRMSGEHSAFAQKDIVFFNPLNGFEPKNLGFHVPVVSLIHDYQHNLYPQWHAFKGASQRNAEYLFEVMRSDAMICISEFEKQNLEDFYGANTGHVVYHAPFLYDVCKSIQPTTNMHGNYFLYPAMPWVHKNHGNLFTAFDLINARRDGNDPLKLICVGFDPDSESFDLGRSVYETLQHKENIQLLGHVSDEALAQLMTHAKGLIFPSLYEGFGIPVVDAMAFGVPVLAVKGSAVPEVAQSTITYFANAHNPIMMAADISEFSQLALAGKIKTSSAQKLAQSYTTKTMAKKTFEVLKAAFEGKKESKVRIASMQKLQNRPHAKTLDIVLDFTSVAQKFDIGETIAKLRKHCGDYAHVLALGTVEQREAFASLDIAVGLVLEPSDKAFDSAFCQLIHTSGQSDYVLYVQAQDAQTLDVSKMLSALGYMHYDEELFSSQFMQNMPCLEISPALTEEKAIPLFRERMQKPRAERLKEANFKIFRREAILVYKSIIARSFISKESLVGNCLVG